MPVRHNIALPTRHRASVALLVLLFTVAPLARAAVAAETAVARGINVEVLPAGVPGVSRITVAPADSAGSKDITIRGIDGEVAWQGRISLLPSFGRAKVPGLEIAWDAHPGESLFGLGERFDRFDQAGKRVDLWIEDAPGQGEHGSRTYYANPLVYSTAGYAFFAADNPEGEFDLNSAQDGVNRYRRAGTSITFYVATGRSLIDLIAQRTAVQGAPRAIPDWAWGPWISRNSYETQAEAEEAIQGHVARGYPVAAIVQEAWKGTSEAGDYNNFSSERWPRLDEFLALCRAHDIRNVLWQVPVIHPSSPHYAQGVARQYFVRKPDGSVSHRKEWLAGFANIDFTNPAAVAWWKEMMRDEVRMGVAGYKADDGEDIKPDDVFFDGRRGWQMHNEYSTLYNKALFELLEEEKADGLLWARSGSLGNERYPALWAGDQEATWQQLRSLIPAGLSASISGMPYWGHDIGGYFGETTPELYVRWLQLGTLSPLMQYHGNKPREPWVFGRTADDAYALLVHLRMNLKPALIALGKEASKTGLPIMRPMVLHDPDDPRFRGSSEDTQYLLGRDMLVAPVMEQGATGRLVKFPRGTWHHALHPMSFAGPGEYPVPVGLVDAPLFIREGAAVPVQLAAGKSLGDWSADAPVRDLTFTAERAVVRNLRAPLTGDPVGRETKLQFDVADGYAGQLIAEWHWADAPDTKRRAPVQRSGSSVSVDLTPPVGETVLGRRQAYVLRDSSSRALFRGEVDWSSPLAIDTQTLGSRVADPRGGSRQVETTLRNRSGRSIEARIAAVPSEGTRVANADRTVTVPPDGEARLQWDVTPASSGGAIGDARVAFTARAGGIDLAHGSAVFAYPGRWVVAGPFPAPPRQAHGMHFAPEWEQSAAVAFELDDDGAKPVRWQQLAPDHLARNGGIDFHAVFGPRDHAAAYAMTRIASDREQPVELRFGSDDTLRVWLNGELVHAVETYRDAAPDQEVVKVTLRRGVNTLVTKVAQDVNRWLLLFRVSGPDGSPVCGLSDGFDEASWNSFAADRPAAARIVRQPPSLGWHVRGPFAAVPKEEASWALPSDAEALSSAVTGDGWRALPPHSAPANRIDLNAVLGPAQNAVAYVATEVVVDEPTSAVLVGGSDDGLTLWLNGQRVYQAEAPRAFSPDSDRVPVMLRAGRNLLVARVAQGGGDWLVQIDFQDPAGRPLSSSPPPSE